MNGFDVRALDVLVEHDPVLRRHGHRLVDDPDVLDASARPELLVRLSAAGASARSARRPCTGCWRGRSAPRCSCARASPCPAAASRPGRPRPRPSSVSPGGSCTIRPGGAERRARLVLGPALEIRHLHLRPARSRPRTSRTTRPGSSAPTGGSVRVILPLSVVSLASVSCFGLKSEPSSRERVGDASRRRCSGSSFWPRETLSRTVSPGVQLACPARGSVATTTSASRWASRTRWRLACDALSP